MQEGDRIREGRLQGAIPSPPTAGDRRYHGAVRVGRLFTFSALLLACPRPDAAPDPAPVWSPLGTFTRVTMMRRVLDGGAQTSGTEVLVVYPDRTAEIRDRDVAGLLIKKGTAEGEPFAALAAALASSEWTSLPAERGAVAPDGPRHVIEVRSVRVVRHDAADDEPVVRSATAAFEQIWTQIDP